MESQMCGHEKGVERGFDLVRMDDERIEYGTGTEECLKLWMEAQAACSEDTPVTVNFVKEDLVKDAEEQEEEEEEEEEEGQGGADLDSVTGEREEWTGDAVTTLLEAYEERLNETNRGSLRAEDWEVVASVVNRLWDGRIGKTVKQCKRKVYSLKRWYKSNRARNNKPGLLPSDNAPLSVLDRIVSPLPWQAGIPGGIDAGERLSEPTPSAFDEEYEGLQSGGAEDGSPVDVSGSGLPRCRKRCRDAEAEIMTKPQSNVSDSRKLCDFKKKNVRHATGPTDDIAAAIRGFTKVLTEIEQTKREILKDLEVRRAELQSNLTKMVKKCRSKNTIPASSEAQGNVR